MRIHILGICGTFMGGIAVIARQAGFKVTGCDQNIYPPMSDALRAAGIGLSDGYGAEQTETGADLLVVGNVMRRGMPAVEAMLNRGLDYVSGPQWLEEHYLRHKKVLAVSGTHGKTTTSAMLAWILECGGLNPGFLIGGIPGNFPCSARDTSSPWFVIEADEYDCAFFDKRSKFIHYHPRILIINNLEYDHADIFANVGEIQRQFHHLIRTMPSEGTVITQPDPLVDEVIRMGCWSRHVMVGGDELSMSAAAADFSAFDVQVKGRTVGRVTYGCSGVYNARNALMAMRAAMAAGVAPETAVQALCSFRLPKRRMELRGTAGGAEVYDDFAHHPTAVKVTLEGMRARIGSGRRLVAVFEPRSNSMRAGANREQLPGAFAAADEVFVYAAPGLAWDADSLSAGCPVPLRVCHDFDSMLTEIVAASPQGSAIVVMSNGGFNGIHQKLLDLLKNRG